MRQPGKDIPARAYGMYCWVTAIVVLLVFGLLVTAWPGSIAQRRRIARAGARILFMLAGMPVEVSGVGHLPRGTHILLANHTSFLDALVLTAALPPSPGYAFVARQEYRSQALLWPLLRAVGTVVLHENSDHSAPPNLKILSQALRRGDNLVIFPEGGIKREPGVQAFHSGAFIAAAQAGIPVAVAGISGARQALPLKKWRPSRACIAVRIGSIFRPGIGDAAAFTECMETAREQIAELAGEEAIGEAVH